MLLLTEDYVTKSCYQPYARTTTDMRASIAIAKPDRRRPPAAPAGDGSTAFVAALSDQLALTTLVKASRRLTFRSILLWVAIPTFSPVGNFRVSF